MSKRGETLGFRIPKELKRELKNIAMNNGQTLSELSRELLYSAISRAKLLTTKKISL